MQVAEFPRYRISFVTALAAAYWALLAWQHTHGGVPSHSLLARDDMPEMSNWWGALLVPLNAWLATGLMQRRLQHVTSDPLLSLKTFRLMAVACGLAFVYAATMGVIFRIDSDSPFLATLFFALAAIGVVLPIYRPEYVMGFTLGLTYTFGPVIPLVIATVLSGISAVAVLLVRPLVRSLFGRLFRA